MRGDEGVSGKDDAEQVVAADGNVLCRFDLPVAVAGHTRRAKGQQGNRPGWVTNIEARVCPPEKYIA